MSCNCSNPFHFVQKPYDPSQYQGAPSPQESVKSLGKTLNPGKLKSPEQKKDINRALNFNPTLEESSRPKSASDSVKEKGKKMYNIFGKQECPEPRPVLKDRWISETSASYVLFGQHPSVCPRNCNIDPKLIFLHNYDAQDPFRNGEKPSFDYFMKCLKEQQARRKSVLDSDICYCQNNNICSIQKLKVGAEYSNQNQVNISTPSKNQASQPNQCQCDNQSKNYVTPTRGSQSRDCCQNNKYSDSRSNYDQCQCSCSQQETIEAVNCPCYAATNSLPTGHPPIHCPCVEFLKNYIKSQNGFYEERNYGDEEEELEDQEYEEEQDGAPEKYESQEKTPSFHNYGWKNVHPTVDSQLMKTHNVSHGNLNESYPFALERRERITDYENQRRSKTSPQSKKSISPNEKKSSTNKKLALEKDNKSNDNVKKNESQNSKSQVSRSSTAKNTTANKSNAITSKSKTTKEAPKPQRSTLRKSSTQEKSEKAKKNEKKQEVTVELEDKGIEIPTKFYARKETLRREARQASPERIERKQNNHEIVEKKCCFSDEFVCPQPLCNQNKPTTQFTQPPFTPKNHDLRFTLGGGEINPVVAFSDRPASCHVVHSVINNKKQSLVDPRNDPKNYAGLPPQYSAFIKPAGEKTEWSLKVSDCLHMFD